MRISPVALALLTALVLPGAAVADTTANVADRGLQPYDLATLDRFSSPVLSPDGSFVVFSKSVTDYGANKASSSLWVRNLLTRDMNPPTRLTPDGWNVNSPAFSPDGKSVYFLSSKSGTSQLYVIAVTGGKPRQLSNFALDVGGFQVSPDGLRVAFSVEAFVDCGSDLVCTKKRLDGREASAETGVVYDRMFVRHWDAWNDGRLNRVFVAELPTGRAMVESATAIAPDVIGDVPSKPFGDSSEYTWAPDSRSLVLSVRKADRTEAWSTNFDLYHVTADGSSGARNLTADNPAWDTGAVFSADGSKLYYRAMKRPGFEADRFGVMELDMVIGERREIAPKWDRSADSIAVSADGTQLFVTAQEIGQHPLFTMDVASGAVKQIIADGSIGSVQLAGQTLAFTRNSLTSGNQIFTASVDGGAERAISANAGEMLPQVKFGDFEQFSFPGWNRETVHGYVLKPWNYQEGKKYPVAFLIHGGPQGSFGNSWSTRWNPQTYAGQGYAVVMIDFHGSTGYGQAFTDAISQHWGDRPLEDLQKGWAAAQKKYAFLDGANACALGASYGGYMINWIAGNWNTPTSGAWKCMVNHDGVFDTRMMGFVTEELWFTEWENGGSPWDKRADYEKFNPSRHVDKWRVPMLVVHGQQDFRIPVSQGLGAFTALQRRGVESKFLYFPDENHWVQKPHNSVQWHDTVNGWLKQYLGQ